MWSYFYSTRGVKAIIVPCAIVLALVVKTATAQTSKSVTIGKLTERPSAILVLNPAGKDQGILIPQLTSEQRLAMHPVSPAENGLFLFDITEKSFYYWRDGLWVKGLGETLSGESLLGTYAAGDLSGKYSSPVVSRLQGNAVAPEVLSAGDAGKVLVWNGREWSPQVLESVNRSTRYAMIDPSAFTNLRRSDKKDKDNIIIFDSNSAYVTTIRKDEGPNIIAPLNLPDGATIQEVALYYMDRETKNLVFNVYRKIPMAGNEAVVSTWTSSGNTPAIRMSVHSPIVGREIVDNSSYSYRIVIQLDQSIDVSGSDDATLRVYAVKIKYLLPKL